MPNQTDHNESTTTTTSTAEVQASGDSNNRGSTAVVQESNNIRTAAAAAAAAAAAEADDDVCVETGIKSQADNDDDDDKEDNITKPSSSTPPSRSPRSQAAAAAVANTAATTTSARIILPGAYSILPFETVNADDEEEEDEDDAVLHFSSSSHRPRMQDFDEESARQPTASSSSPREQQQNNLDDSQLQEQHRLIANQMEIIQQQQRRMLQLERLWQEHQQLQQPLPPVVQATRVASGEIVAEVAIVEAVGSSSSSPSPPPSPRPPPPPPIIVQAELIDDESTNQSKCGNDFCCCKVNPSNSTSKRRWVILGGLMVLCVVAIVGVVASVASAGEGGESDQNDSNNGSANTTGGPSFLAPTSAPTTTISIAPQVPPSSSDSSTAAPEEVVEESPVPTSSPVVVPIPQQVEPTTFPTKPPTVVSTGSPSIMPTKQPTLPPSTRPTKSPTIAPTSYPTDAPTISPTTDSPSLFPSLPPSSSASPTLLPLNITWTRLGQTLQGETADDRFGVALDLSADGNRVAVGAYTSDGAQDTLFNSGHVRVYDFDKRNQTWNPVGRALYGVNAGGQFGRSVALSANASILAAGGSGENGNGAQSGVVRIYTLEKDGWAQMGQDINGLAPNDWLGRSVALSENGVIVAAGADGGMINGDRSGYVLAMQFNGSAWNPMGQTLSGLAVRDSFGESVALSADGTIMAVGAIRADDTARNVRNVGHVQVFRFNEINLLWENLGQPLFGTAEGDEFGYAIDLSSDGNILAVGGYEHDAAEGGADAGCAMVFQYNGTTWNLMGSALIGGVASGWFGVSVALSTTSDGTIVLAVGASGEGGIGTGRMHLYVYNDIAHDWIPVNSSLQGESANDRFGYSIALSHNGGVVAVGAYRHNSDAGQVQIFAQNILFNSEG